MNTPQEMAQAMGRVIQERADNYRRVRENLLKRVALLERMETEWNAHTASVADGTMAEKFDKVVAELGRLGYTEIRIVSENGWSLDMVGVKQINGRKVPITLGVRMTRRGMHVSARMAQGWRKLLEMVYYKKLVVRNYELDRVLEE